MTLVRHFPRANTSSPTEGLAPSAFGHRFTVPLILGASLNPINSSIVATALVPIATALGSSVGRVTLLVTVLYAASAVAQPAMGRLAEVLGPRKVFMAGAVLVSISGVVGLFAQDLTALVAARILLGIGTSAGFPAAMVMIRRQADNTGGDPSGTLGALVIASQVTVLAGLPLGGLLVSSAGWRATFWINIPLGVLVLVLAAGCPVDERRETRGLWSMVRRTDPLGMVLFGGFLSSLVAFLTHDNAPLWTTLAAAIASGMALLVWEAWASDPFIDVAALVDNLGLTLTYLRSAAMMLVAYCVMYGLTQWLQGDRGLSATATGLLIVPMSAAGALVTRPVARRGLVRVPLVVGAVLALCSALALRLLGASSPIWFVVAITAVVGVSVGLAAVGNQSAVFAQAGARQTGTAAGLLRTSGYLGAIASGSLIGHAFPGSPDEAGLHGIAEVLIVVTALLVVLVVVDRRLPRSIRAIRSTSITGE